MPDRYDRSVCAGELLLRNTIVTKMADGWGPAGAFRLPTTVSGHLRIGKSTDEVPLPPHDVAPLGDCSILTVEVLPAVNNNASGDCAQVAQADFPADHKVDLAQTQRNDDSKN